jgi:hypothetical protein
MAMASTKKEHEMDREHEMIELGVVSTDTKGLGIPIDDEEGGLRPPAGLSAD